MKTKILLIFCLLPTMSFSQSFNFTLKGKVGIYSSPAKMFLTYSLPGKKTVIDSAIIQNGNFEFKGVLDIPVNANLMLRRTAAKINISKISEEDLLLIYLEPGTININGTNSLSASKIRGGKLNKDYAIYLQGIKPTVDSLKAVLKAFSIDKKITGDQATKQIDSLMSIYDRSHQTFVAKHLGSPVSIYVLESYIANDKNINEASSLYAKLSNKIKSRDRAIDLLASLEKKKKALYSQQPTNIGDPAPNFEQPDVLGNKVTLNQFRGKYLFLDFWASWCKPCRAENPNLVEGYRRFKEKGLEIMSISIDGLSQKQAWLNAIKADGLTWTQVSDLKAWDNSAALIYGVKAIPENYLIDPTGKIIAKNLRGEELLTMLNKIFNK
jgi:peroxiredoxin